MIIIYVYIYLHVYFRMYRICITTQKTFRLFFLFKFMLVVFTFILCIGWYLFFLVLSWSR